MYSIGIYLVMKFAKRREMSLRTWELMTLVVRKPEMRMLEARNPYHQTRQKKTQMG
jgi:hypothetical protein